MPWPPGRAGEAVANFDVAAALQFEQAGPAEAPRLVAPFDDPDAKSILALQVAAQAH